MEELCPTSIALLEIDDDKTHKVSRRRRNHQRDTKDNDFIPQLYPVAGQARHQAHVPREVPEHEIPSFIEGYDLILRRDYNRRSAFDLNRSSIQEYPINAENKTKSASAKTSRSSSMESINLKQSLPTTQIDLDQSTQEEPTNSRPTSNIDLVSSSNTTIPPSPLLTAYTPRKHAYSLSNAIANLRDLPWHIDLSRSNKTLSLNSLSDGSTSKEHSLETPTSRTSRRSFFQRMKQHLTRFMPGKKKPVERSQSAISLQKFEVEGVACAGELDSSSVELDSLHDDMEALSLGCSWVDVDANANEEVMNSSEDEDMVAAS